MLLLKKNGEIDILNISYDKQYDEYVESDHETIDKTEDILSYLTRKVCLVNNFTIRDWFRLIMNYTELQKLNILFPLFIEEYNKCPTEDFDENKLKSLELQRTIYIDEEECIIQYDIDIIMDDNEATGIDLLPLNYFIDLELNLSDTCNIFIEEGDKSYKAKMEFSLWEFIDAIITEISWYGNPNERDMNSKEIIKNYNTINGIKND